MDALWQYSQRNLTYEKDILRAVQGSLKSFESIDIHSLWGVPEFELAERTSQGVPDVDRKTLLLGLTWLICRTDSQVVVERIQKREGLLSWNWVGWKGTVSWSGASQWQGTDATVAVELNDGSQISWEEARIRVADDTLSKSLTRFIHITACCVDVTIAYAEKYEGGATWVAKVRGLDGNTYSQGIANLRNTMPNDSEQGVSTDVRLEHEFYIAILLGDISTMFNEYPRQFIVIAKESTDCFERVASIPNGCWTAMSVDEPRDLVPWDRKTIRLG